MTRFVPPDSDSEPVSGYHPWYDGTSSLTHYVSTGATNSTIVVSGAGWTTNQFAGRKLTTLKNYLNTPPLALISDLVVIVASNTSDTITIVGTWAVNPVVGTTFRVGTGRFITYHPIPNLVGFGNGLGTTTISLGSGWAQGGVGVGPDNGAMREFHNRLFSETGFYFAKFVDVQGVVSGWRSGGSSRTAFSLELTRILAAALADTPSNTIDWKLIVIDLSAIDIAHFDEDIGSGVVPGLLYASELAALITWLKSGSALNAPNAYVQLISHNPGLNPAKAGAAQYVRGLHTSYALANAKTATIDMSFATFDTSAHLYYTTNNYFDLGRKIVDTYIRQTTNSITVPTNGMPMYFLIGDSIGVGEISQQWAADSLSAELLGPETDDTSRPPTQLVYNRINNTLEPYDPLANPNTSGTITANCGPEVTITAELAKLHPDGFVLVKRCSNGSSLCNTTVAYSAGAAGRWEKSAGEHYPELLADIAAAEELVFTQYGQIPDWRGGFVTLGHNDCASVGGGALFAARLATFIRDLREDLTTRTSGKDYPISWRRPQATAAGLSATEINAVRAALSTRQTADSQFRWFDVDDLERKRSDNLHETPESALIHGRRAVAALRAIAL